MAFVLDVLLLYFHVHVFYFAEDGLVLEYFFALALRNLLPQSGEVDLLYFLPDRVVDLSACHACKIVSEF